MGFSNITEYDIKIVFPFPNPREGQLEVIRKILQAFEKGKKYVVLNSPTGCFTGDTKVSLLDGTERTFEELVRDYHDKEFWVYSCKPDGEIVPGKAHSPRVTKYVDELVEVTLDNNEVVRCTPDHKWMMRDGTYREAKDLVESDSLMPLYRGRDENGYELVKCNRKISSVACKNCKMFTKHCGRTLSRGGFIETHCVVAKNLYQGSRHNTRHHINFNKNDNRPENIKWCSKKAHKKYHTLIYNKSEIGRLNSSKAGKINGLKSTTRLVEYNRSKRGRDESRRRAEHMRNLINSKSPEEKLIINIKRGIGGFNQKCKKLHNSDITKCPICIEKYNKILDKIEIVKNNHKVVKVEKIKLNTSIPVYDITVDKYHNFVLTSGVFVHNSGKSVIGITVANFLARYKRERSYVLVSEKILQKQYMDDFKKDPNIVMLMGKGNYLCSLTKESYTTGKCHSISSEARKTLPCFSTCEYRKRRRLAKEANVVISNYSYLLSDIEYLPQVIQLGNRPLTIFDECHNLEGILLSHSVVSLDEELFHEISKKLLKLKEVTNLDLTIDFRGVFNVYERIKQTSIDDVEGFFTVFEEINSLFKSIKKKVDTITSKELAKHEDVLINSLFLSLDDERKITALTAIGNFFDNFSNKVINKIDSMLDHKGVWVADKEIKGNIVYSISLSPVFTNYLFNKTFKKNSDKFLFMSGTPQTVEELKTGFDIDPEEIEVIEVIEVPSPFPVENRLVHQLNLFDLSYKNLQNELPNVLDFIDFTIEQNSENIMIHTGNYVIAEYIWKNTKYQDRMVFPRPETRDACIAKFKASKGNVMISPSLMEGLSLDDDFCRVQLIVKVPYMSLADRRVKKRMEMDPVWYSANTVRDIVQASGRGVRSKTDHCETFILDKAFTNLLRYNKKMFPLWFLESLR